jgi:hypothetical protein
MEDSKVAAMPRVNAIGIVLTLVVALMLLAPRVGTAQRMVGTEYNACLDKAEIQDGICYLEADGYWDKVDCNIEYLTNVTGCISQLAVGLSGLSGLAK